MKCSKTKSIIFLIIFIIIGLYFGNAAWLAPSNASERQILAHRGLHQTYSPVGVKIQDCTATIIESPVHDYLENTLPSIKAAIELGADIVEIDIHPTSDGEFVVFHDWTLDCRTNGSGVVRHHDLAHLKSLDVGYGYTADGGDTFPFRGQHVGAMPTLAEVLTTFPETPFLVNIKSADDEEAQLLTDYLQAGQFPNQDRLSVYGSSNNILLYAELNPDTVTLSKQRVTTCMKKYLLVGWSGYIPKECHNSYITVPKNFQWLVWGWPNRFENRLHKVGSRALLMGDFKKGNAISGIDDLESIPPDFGGLVWTNRIDIVGQKQRVDEM